MLPRGVLDLPITDWPFLSALGAAWLAATVLAVRVFLPRRGRFGRVVRVVAVAAVIVLAGLDAAAALNTYVDFDRTLGDALGVVPADEVPLANLLRRTTVPATGVVAPLPIPTPVSHFPARPALVYLPPAWFHRPRPRLPVLVLLHGTLDDTDVWFRAGQASAIADRWASAHHGVAPILVAPDINGSLTADTECVDSSLGHVETALTVDLPRYITSTFRTLPPGRAWAIAGFSEGGSCALMLALRHPQVFATVGDYSGLVGPRSGDTNDDTAPTVASLFAGSRRAFDDHEPAVLLAHHRYPGLGAWFDVGDADPEPAAAQRLLVPAARAAGMSVCSVVIAGGTHTFDVFSAALADSLPWISSRLGLGPPNATCPHDTEPEVR